MNTPLPQFFPPLPASEGCTSCDLTTGCKRPGISSVVRGDYDPNKPTLYVLGMNPGLEEDTYGTPFIGPSGKLLTNTYLTSTSITALANIIIGNSARCYTSTKPPTSKQFRDCTTRWALPELAHLHNTSKSLTLLALGAHAVATLTKLFDGKPLPLASAIKAQPLSILIGDTNVPLFVTYHPAALLRDNSLIQPVRDHLQHLYNHLLGHEPFASKPHITPPAPPLTHDLHSETPPCTPQVPGLQTVTALEFPKELLLKYTGQETERAEA